MAKTDKVEALQWEAHYHLASLTKTSYELAWAMGQEAFEAWLRRLPDEHEQDAVRCLTRPLVGSGSLPA
jgi:hypothetical protein